MDLELLKDMAVTLHLMALIFGMGVALVSDFNSLKMFFRPLTSIEIQKLHLYHRVVFLGLGMFWVSGLVLVWFLTEFRLAQVSDKLAMKLLVVTILSLNAVMIGKIGLWALRHYFGFRFGEMPTHIRYKLGFLAGVSASGWISALLLGGVSTFKTMEFEQLSQIVGAIYFVGISSGFLMAAVSPFLLFKKRSTPPQPLGETGDPSFEAPGQASFTKSE